MNGHRDDPGTPERQRSRFADAAGSADSLNFTPPDRGQNCPQHCPQREIAAQGASPDLLGDPMTIREVATLMKCSAWTIRQRYLRAGLPHFRLSRNGKLVFYRNQIVRWVLEKQRQKGGIIR